MFTSSCWGVPECDSKASLERFQSEKGDNYVHIDRAFLIAMPLLFLGKFHCVACCGQWTEWFCFSVQYNLLGYIWISLLHLVESPSANIKLTHCTVIYCYYSSKLRSEINYLALLIWPRGNQICLSKLHQNCWEQHNHVSQLLSSRVSIETH